MNALIISRVITLASYFGLIVLLLAWNTLLAPSVHFPVALVIMVLVLPLLLPLRGILHGRAYTHAWSSFLALFYFVYGVGEAAAGVDPIWLSASAISLSVFFFAGCVGFARFKARADKAAGTAK